MKYTAMSSFQDENGRVDWNKYDAAQVANGEKCRDCGAYITYGGNGYSVLCYECKNLTKDDEVTHHSLLRCPHCAWIRGVDEDYHLYEEGEQEVCCYECNKSFEVSVRATYTFTSPALEKEENNDST